MTAVIESSTPMPVLAEVPGIVFRHFRGIDADIPGMAAANQAAHLAEPGQDVTLWSIAFDGEQVAGGVRGWIKIGHDGAREGWLYPVFTGAAWRRRGLARALIGRTLVLLRDRGADRAALGADLQNPNQTLTLYGSCGLRLASSTTAWRKALVLDEDVR